MNELDLVLKTVLKQITPTKHKRIETERIIKKILTTTDKVIKKLGLERTLAGSFLRDTWLADRKEFDIFILFPTHYKRERLESLSLKLGKKIVKLLNGSYEIAYAEHPYVRAKIGNYEVDFVPCYKVKSATKIKSAVDRTPFHNQYILKHLAIQLTPQVRLLKQFCRGLGIYGSDLKTQGLSGYLCELLIMNYGLFKDLVKKVAKWKAGKVFIDLEAYYANKIDLKEKFPNQPLIVIDPVDSNRNVAASLACANFMKFVKACEEFVNNPKEEFFWLKKEKIKIKEIADTIKNRKTQLLAIEFKKPDVVDDIIWPQLRKTARRIKDILEASEFKVLGYGVFSDNLCVILLELEVWELPKIRKIIGPPTFSIRHSEQFISKYKSKGRIWVEDLNWAAEIERKFTLAEAKLKNSLSVSSKKLKAKGIASYIADSLVKEFKILKAKEIIKLARKDEEIGEFLKNYFSKRII